MCAGVFLCGGTQDIISRFMNVFNVTRSVEGNMSARVLRSITYVSVELAIKTERNLRTTNGRKIAMHV